MTSARHRPLRRSLALRTATASACLILLLLLGACELRLETPAPTAPSPGAIETVRQRAATDSVTLAAMALLAAGGARTDGAEATVVATLEEVVTTSDLHATALGGVYQPWPASATPTPSPTTAAPVPEPVPTVSDVVTALQGAADRASADAGTVADGPLARLLASVATSRTVLADALDARSTGATLALPTVGPTTPTSADPSPAPSPAPTTPSGQQTAARPPGAVPGLQDSSLTALLEAEDELGAGWEVLAARSAGEDRSRAALVATGHRARAQEWATALGVDGTALDPRRDAYALPGPVLDPGGDARTALVDLEARLGARLAGLVAQAEPGSRGPFIQALAANALLVLQAAGTTVAFPGLDEASGAPAASSPSP